MSNKKLTIIFVIIVVLLGVLFFSRQEVTGDEKQRSFSFTSTITPEEINRITIASGESPVVLTRDGNSWMTGTRATEPALLTKIWDTFADVSFNGPVSKNPANHSRFEVSADTGITVTFYQGETEKARMIIGKTAKSFANTYIRINDADEVYESSKNLAVLFPTDEQNWYDKTIVAIDTNNISQLAYTYPDTSFTLQKNESTWILIQGSEEKILETEKIEAILNQLTKLSGLRFLSDPNIQTFEGTSDKIILSIRSGDTVLAHLILLPKESETWVKKEGSSNYYALSSFITNILLPDPTSL